MYKQFIKDTEELVMYASICAKILKENGYAGKAKALEKRYMKVNKYIKQQTMLKKAQQTKIKDLLKQQNE